MASNDHCRRCGSRLTGVSSMSDSSIATELAGLTSDRHLKTCPLCDWRNLAELPESQLPLKLILDHFPELANEIVCSSDSATSCAVLKTLRRRLVARLRAEVRANVTDANAWLLGALSDLDELERIGSSALLCIQQVYLSLLEVAPIAVFAPRVDRIGPFWQRPVAYLTESCVAISQVLREARLGASVQIDEHRNLILQMTEDAQWASEMNANVQVDPSVTTELDRAWNDTRVREAERITFGYSVRDMVELLRAPEVLDKYTRVDRGKLHLAIDLAPEADRVVHRVAADFMLTHERVRRHSVPSFFFAASALDKSAAARNAADRKVSGLSDAGPYRDPLEHAAIELDWLTYAPLLVGGYRSGGQLRPVALTTPYLIHRTAAKAAATVAFRLHNASEAARTRYPNQAAQVASISRDVHARFEQDIARRFDCAGLESLYSLEDLAGRRLVCGEIDVLSWCDRPGQRPVAVVCEAKNNDVSFYKDFGIQNTQAVIRGAREQVLRKATWVSKHWRDIAKLFSPSLSPDMEPFVIAMVVTRVAALPLSPGSAAFITAAEVQEIAGQLKRKPERSWRPDLIAAIVVRDMQ